MKTLKQAQVKSETEQKVDSFLSNMGVTFSVFPAGAGLKRDNWECDGWRVVLGKADTSESFDYYTGIGHRVIVKTEEYEREKQALEGYYNKRCVAAQGARLAMEACKRPFAPFAASVLNSLLMDGMACEQSFNNWCSEYGYSDDSLKALGTYRACCENGEKLRRIFTRQQIDELAELLADY